MPETTPPMSSISLMYWLASFSIWSVSASTYQLPPSGSTVRWTPVSCARICCVRSATRTAVSVGRPSVSSMLSVCRLWQPPRTPAMAW